MSATANRAWDGECEQEKSAWVLFLWLKIRHSLRVVPYLEIADSDFSLHLLNGDIDLLLTLTGTE